MSNVTWSVGSGLEGRGVIVTGAAGGIGSAITKALATTGARILALDVDQGRVDAVLAECDGEGHIGLATDLTDLASHAGLVDTATREFGGVYALIHAAAVLRRASDLDAVSEQDWDFQLDTNLKSTFFLSRTVANSMIEAGQGGRIVLFSSQGWWTGGFGGSVVYSASKGGVVSMSRGLARTYGPLGITVNTISPGVINTSMMRTDLDPAVKDRLAKETPLGHIGEPDDVAGVAVFLASEHARFISGATINVSGAFLMY
jgi:NAD(P)-dependent dehydrogenase (short-subunit alcohol dehydrogenase family)